MVAGTAAGPDRPQADRRACRMFICSCYPGRQLRGLDRRLPAHRPRATRCSRASTGTCGRGACGTDSARSAGPRTRLRAEPRFRPRHVQHRRGPGLADQHGHRADLPGHPALAEDVDFAGGLRVTSLILKFTWYDKLGPGRNVPGRRRDRTLNVEHRNEWRLHKAHIFCILPRCKM